MRVCNCSWCMVHRCESALDEDCKPQVSVKTINRGPMVSQEDKKFGTCTMKKCVGGCGDQRMS